MMIKKRFLLFITCLSLLTASSCYSKYLYPFPVTELILEPASGTEYRVGEAFRFFVRARFPNSGFLPNSCHFSKFDTTSMDEDYSVTLVRGSAIDYDPMCGYMFTLVEEGDDCVLELLITPLKAGIQTILFGLSAVEEPQGFYSYQAIRDVNYTIEVLP